MSAEIFNAPEQIKQPVMDFANFDRVKYDEENERYISELKQFIKDNGYTGKNAGEIIRFPVADGYAEYMVVSMRPVRLIHIPLGDAWNFQYAHLLTAKEVQASIDKEKALEKLFGGK